MATRHANGRAVVKGAPEAVLPLCRDAGDAGARVEALADAGERVLVFAARDDAPPGLLEDALGGLRLLGLPRMVDPPREAAPAAVATACARGSAC